MKEYYDDVEKNIRELTIEEVIFGVDFIKIPKKIALSEELNNSLWVFSGIPDAFISNAPIPGNFIEVKVGEVESTEDGYLDAIYGDCKWVTHDDHFIIRKLANQ